MYTVSKEADKKIEKDLGIIREIILKRANPRAIVLFGGFGHGGGSFKRTKSGILPLNDYDLYIISDKNIDGSLLEKWGEECSKALNRGGMEIVENFNEKYDENRFFHVDLHCLEYRKLKKLYPTQRSFDLRTSQVIYGDRKILEKISEIKISKSDAIRLLFNKLNHFAIAEKNSDIIKSIYAVKGLTDLASALLISQGKYASRYQDREKEIMKIEIPDELKKLIKIATKAKLYDGYEVKEKDFFEKSKKWVEWGFKKIIKKYLRINEDCEDWKIICRKMYEKLPYWYFDDYLGNKYLFFGQYYLNITFFMSGLRKNEFLIKNLFRWRDAGLILGISMILYSYGEEKEAEKYLKKLTNDTKPLKDRLMKIYSLYYLQKLI